MGAETVEWTLQRGDMENIMDKNIVPHPIAGANELFPIQTQTFETLWYEMKAEFSGNMCSVMPVSAMTRQSGRAFGGMAWFVEVSRRCLSWARREMVIVFDQGDGLGASQWATQADTTRAQGGHKVE